MGQVIRLKRSTTSGLVHAASALVDGELAINLADRRLFAKDSAGEVFEIGGSGYALLDSPELTGTPTAPTAAPESNDNQLATTAFVQDAVDRAIAGLDFQRDVLGVQTDATLDPGAAPAAGDRYVITDPAALHANFGTIAGLEANDIVEFNGTSWTVAYDVSVEGEGSLAWDRSEDRWVRWDGLTWDAFGGLAGVVGGIAVTVNGDTINLDLSKLVDLGESAAADDFVVLTDTSDGGAHKRVSVQNLVANVELDGGVYA